MKDLFLSILKEEEEYDTETGVKIKPKPGGIINLGINDKNVIIPRQNIGGSGLSPEWKRRLYKGNPDLEPHEVDAMLKALSDREKAKREKEQKEPFQRQFGDKK